MTIRRFGKLVRDRIPEIIERNGERVVVRLLPPDEFVSALDAKLIEELTEFRKSPSCEEAADLLEVAYSLITASGLDLDEVERCRQSRLVERGGFEMRVFLETVQADGPEVQDQKDLPDACGWSERSDPPARGTQR